MNTLKTTVAATALTALAVAAPRTAHAAPDKLAYELQERCGKTSAQFVDNRFDKSHSFAERDYVSVNFENHYNIKLNSCFLLIQKTEFITNSPKFPEHPILKEWELYNANENSQLAYLNCIYGREDVSASDSHACEIGDFRNIHSGSGIDKHHAGLIFAYNVQYYMERDDLVPPPPGE